MRPIRLELEGFTAYREYTVVDFEGAELFVFTGPTGSGKSSLIDAMTFALYGSVSRYGNPNLVHPVVSQGKVEAKVRFDFTLDGKRYTAVRVVRKTPRGGATTKEARLESGTEVLAANAEEVTRRVRELIGLNFDQFTTCVVLPQGDFARFLHETPGQRQDLLTKLLGVDIYEAMGTLAREREISARRSVELHREELDRLKGASKAQERRMKDRVASLIELKHDAERAEPELSELERKAADGEAEASRFEKDAVQLRSVETPPGVSELAGKLQCARATHEEMERARATAEEAHQAAEVELGSLPDARELEAVRRDQSELASKRTGLAKLELERENARRALLVAQERVEGEARCLDEARAVLEEARRSFAAHELRTHLKRGNLCPVCGRKLTKRPESSLPPALGNAERDVESARSHLRDAESAVRRAEKEAIVSDERTSALQHDIESIEKALTKAPEPSVIAETLAAIAEAEARVASLKERARAAAREEKQGREGRAKLERDEAEAFRLFDEARDRLAALSPPGADRSDLSKAWQSLSTWSRARAEKLKARAEDSRRQARLASERRKAQLDDLRGRARDLEIQIDDERPRDAVVSALATAEQELLVIREAIDRARGLRVKLETDREAASVAGALGQHLKSTGFERWLLEETFRRLVEGATDILRELSRGQYSFEYDEKLNFEIVDHRNADERRSARTLSGGETFLASLALALTLAEQTAELAARGSAKLESLFLDEGFGTLDDDTLEVVAAAIEELGARGRIVGLVTHQQSLAEKIPVQYRVSKGPITATVEKVLS
jgi:exonuclease SbcC